MSHTFIRRAAQALYVLIVLVLIMGMAPVAAAASPVYVDDDWAGLTPGVDPDGAGPATVFGSDAFATIQEGVNAVDSGGAVHVAAGTYEEQVVIDKPLTLQGAGAGVTTILSPVSLSQFFVTAGPNNNYPVVYVHDTGGVNIQDLTVDGAGRGNANYRFIGVGYRNAGGTVADVTILDIRNEPINGAQHGVGLYAYADDGNARTLDVSDTTITGFQKNGMAFLGADLTANVTGNTVTGAGAVDFIAQNGIQISLGATGVIADNDITGFAYTPASYASAGVLVWDAGGAVSTSGNTVQEAQVGIWYINAEGAISSNTLTHTGAGMGATPYWWGIVADPGEGITQQPPPSPLDGDLSAPKSTFGPTLLAALSTTVQNNVLNGGGTGTGIEADALGTETLTFLATGNSVTNFDAGFVLYKDAGATLNATVTGNSIAGNDLGLDNQSGVLQDASANWWGSNDPVDVAGDILGDVDYTPWLNSGADTDLGTFGFQGDFSFLNVDDGSPQVGATGRIQEGVNLLTSGGTVNVLAGTYEENILLDKPLALTGAGQAAAFVYPAVSAPNPSPCGSLCPAASSVIRVQASDVTISGFTVDGDNPALVSGVVRGTADLDARNGIITNHLVPGVYDNLEVHHVTVQNIYLRGIYASNGDTFDVHDNTVQNVRGEANSVAIMNWAGSGIFSGNTVDDANDGVVANHSSGTQFLNNVVTNSDSGVHTDNNGSGGGVADLLQGNEVSNCTPGGYGVWVFAPFVGPTVDNNTVTNCAVGLAASRRNGANPVTTVFTNNVVDGALAANSAGVYVTTDGFGWGSTDVSASFTGNTIINNEDGFYLESQPGFSLTVTASGNNISGNTNAGVTKAGTGAFTVDFANNWWGAAAGPGPVGQGLANGIAADVDYQPWWATPDGSVTLSQNPDGSIAVPASTPDDVVQAVISSARPGTVVELGPGDYAPVGGFLLDAPGVTLRLAPGAVILPSSPCFTVAADNITLSGGVCQPSGGSHGVLTGDDVANLVIKNMEIRDGPADGIHIGHNVNNLQILDNYIHNMAGDGLEYAASVAVTGVHEVQGNLFQSNTGFGVNNASASAYDVEYNSWGHLDGPASGDGANGLLDSDPWTHVELFLASSGSPVADKVGVGSQITYTVNLDAEEVFAADFDLAFDKTKLSVVSITNGSLFTPAGGPCAISTPAEANASGVISYCGNSIAEVDGPAQPVYTVVFQGLAQGIVSLDFDEADDAFGMAPPGGASTNIYAHALDDGSVTVYPAFAVTGRIDLQGRANDSGAIMTFNPGAGQGYGPFVFSASDYWGSIGASGVVEDTYPVLVSMDRYLDVTVASNRNAAISGAHIVLNTLVLLGGDADDDNQIKINDAAIIGGQFGNSGGGITIPGADINNDSVVNILDLVLVGGNFNKTSATAYSGYTP